MISWAGWWNQTPSATPLQPKKWNAYFWITFNFWWLAGLLHGIKPHPPPLSCQKNEMLIFGLHSLLMIGWASWWTWTPSATPLLPKKWNAHFLIMFNFWWSAWLVNGLKTHLPPLSSQKKWNAYFWITFNFWWSAKQVEGLKPHPPPLSTPKNEILIFGLRSTSDDQPGWSMDSNPIHHSSPAKKNEMLIFGLRSLLMICLADWWTWTSSATPLLSKKWNAQFLNTFNFWWSARLVDELKPHLPPLSS